MKNIFKIVCLTVAFGTCATSCDDFFSSSSNSLSTSGDVFSNISDAEMAVYGVYNTISNCWSKRVSMFFPLDDDLINCKAGSAPGNDNSNLALARYTFTQGNSELPNWHRAMYQGVGRANVALQNLRKSPLMSGNAEEQKACKRMIGECLTLKAIMMSEIVKIWGDVPYPTKAPEAGDNFNIPATNRDSIYDYLIKDLQEAVDYLPWRKESSLDERISKGAAKAMIARICLFRGGYSLRKGASPTSPGVMERPSDYKQYYELARKELSELIGSEQHLLNPSYENVFRNVNELKLDHQYGENMLEIAWAGTQAATCGEVGYYCGPICDANSSFGKATGDLNVTPLFYYLFAEGDSRRDISVCPYQIDKNSKCLQQNLVSMFPGKWRRNWRKPLLPSTTKYTEMNWILIRYSDVLLMYAEVENELNQHPTQKAIEAYEKVRSRAYNGDKSKMGVTPTSYNLFFEAIIRERALELSGEGVRKYDLIRWNRLGSALKEIHDTAAKMQKQESPYENVPEYMWYQSEGENIVLSTIEKEGYTRVEWSKSITDTYLKGLATNFFQPNRNELYPFATATLSLNPNIENYYGY